MPARTFRSAAWASRRSSPPWRACSCRTPAASSAAPRSTSTAAPRRWCEVWAIANGEWRIANCSTTTRYSPSRDPGHIDHARADRGERLVRRGDRAVDIDAAAGVLDHDRREAAAVGILGRVADAEVEGEAGEEDAGEATLPQIRGQAGRRRVVVLVKSRIGIDLAAKALAHDQLGLRRDEVVAEFGALRFLHAVI